MDTLEVQTNLLKNDPDMEETLDRQLIVEEMDREGHYNNQEHYFYELDCRIARKKQQRKEMQQKNKNCNNRVYWPLSLDE